MKEKSTPKPQINELISNKLSRRCEKHRGDPKKRDEGEIALGGLKSFGFI